MIEDVLLTPLVIIDVPGGDVLRAMRCEDPGYEGYGEAYFSTVEPEVIKAWKYHHSMTLNIVVPVGAIKFVLFDDRDGSTSRGRYQVVELSRKNYSRLTVPPKIWFGFQGLGSETSILLNIANIMHSPDESDRKELDEVSFDWSEQK